MYNIDMHFHSKLSDGRLHNEEILAEAKNRGIDFLVCTDHDIINSDFTNLAKQSGLMSLEGVEISAMDDRNGKRLHLTAYSKRFKKEVHDLLLTTRGGKLGRIQRQVEVLSRNGFLIDWGSFSGFFEAKGVYIENLNSTHLASYIHMSEHNLELLEKLTGERMDRDVFIGKCLKERGDYKWIGHADVSRYEPSLGFCGDMASRSSAVLSLAHPNFKLNQDEFIESIGYYMDCGITAIEINSKATKEWVYLILKYQKKFGYMVTFGSDCHFKKHDDKEHGEFGFKNSALDTDFISDNVGIFLQKIGLK